MIKLKKYLQKTRKRGTSPIIATMMIIGLTVLSGAILYGVTVAFVSSQPTLDLSYNTQAVYKTSENSILFSSSKIDTVQIPVSNPNLEQMTIDLASSTLINKTDNSVLSGWTAVQDSGAYLTLNGKESATVTFSSIGTNLLNVGDQYYANFSIMTPDFTNSKSVITSTFTVSQSNMQPYFQFVPTLQTVNQDNYNITFYANSTQSAIVNITGVLWNLGNPDTAYQKSVQFYVENDTVFTVDPQYTGTQSTTVTIPSSSNFGYYDANHPDVCMPGYACVNISIPVTKNAVNNTQVSYGAYLSITGMDLQVFQLNVKVPTVRITLQNTNFRNWGFFHWRRHHTTCPSAPNWNNDNQQANTIVFYGSPSCTDTKTVKFDIWNLLDTPNDVNIEISGLNTTAFTLLTKPDSTRWTKYSDNPQALSLTAGPGRSYRWISYCRFPSSQACDTVTWGIARNPLVDSNGNPTGIEAGYYPITVTDLNSGTQQQFELYIQPYIVTVHVSGMEGEYNSNTNTLSYTVSVQDSDGFAVRLIKVSADHTYLIGTGNGKKTQTSSESSYTNRNGVASFTFYHPKNGKNTLLVTDLSAFTFNNFGRWRRFSSTIVIYDSSLNDPHPPQKIVNVG